MSFSIQLLDEAAPAEGSETEAQYGLITLNSFEERFVTVTTVWTPDDYRRHWRHAVNRIVETGRDSCLITSVHYPADSRMLFWWPMYRVGETVRVQNGILFFDQLSRPFDLSDPYPSVPPRTTVSEEGQPVSEWQVSLVDMKEFLTRERS